MPVDQAGNLAPGLQVKWAELAVGEAQRGKVGQRRIDRAATMNDGQLETVGQTVEQGYPVGRDLPLEDDDFGTRHRPLPGTLEDQGHRCRTELFDEARPMISEIEGE